MLKCEHKYSLADIRYTQHNSIVISNLLLNSMGLYDLVHNDYPKQEVDKHPQLFTILTGTWAGKTGDVASDISEKIPTKQHRK